MSIVLSIYTKNAYKEYQMPAAINTETSIGISRQYFELKEDLSLRLEAVNGLWKFKRNRRYTLSRQDGDAYTFLKSNDVISINTSQDEAITAIVTEMGNSFTVFNKYNISSLSQITIGTSEDNLICYKFQGLVSRHHALLKKSGSSWIIEDTSSNGVFVNEAKIQAPVVLRVGDCVHIFGLKIIYLNDRLAINAVNPELLIHPSILPLHYFENQDCKKAVEEDKIRPKRYFHRSPRNITPLETDPIEIEAPPEPRQMQKKPLFLVIGPSFTMAIPMLLGTVMAIYSTQLSGGASGAFLYTGIITAVGSAALGVFWAIVNLKYEKKTTDEAEKHRFEAYSAYLIKQVDTIKEKYLRSRQTLLELYPDAQTCASYGKDHTALWSRNRSHEDFLVHRLGLGNFSFQIPIDVPKERFSLSMDNLKEKPAVIKQEYKTLYDVPVRVDLWAHHLIGLIGGSGKQGALDIMHILSAQIAANNSYTDVKLVYIYDGSVSSQEWEFAKWFPHVWSEDKKTRYVASSKEEASDVFYELVKIFRMKAEEEKPQKKQVPKPYYIMFVANPGVLEGELITKYIYDSQDFGGLTTFIMAESYEQLPNLCEYVIQKDEIFQGAYELADVQRQSIEFDQLSREKLDRMSRTLSGIEVKEVEKGGDIPNALTFLEMYHVNRPEDLHAQELWRKNRNYENMKAAVGLKAGGELCYLDVHEKYHGPHGLVAGTTGSGKSETLQTYMLSLALNFSPDDINFFIIDYKGGGMANLFEGLPHMIGQISNLSGNQVRRAMVSIKSENKRRQRIFNENNVNNINLYTKLYKNGEAAIPVPHLFIIIDEFAELKREESDFMKELISVAQVGRSLGVHLILATQKPSGTVDDNIWSNSKFRMCLRVQDRQDSNDMLHKPDAAYITQAGRCYLQVGNDEIYELFQSAYSGAVYDENTKSQKEELASMISLTGKAALIGSNLKRKQQAEQRFIWIFNLVQIMLQVAADRNQIIEELAESSDRMKALYAKLAYFQVNYPETDYNASRLDELLQVYSGISKLIGGGENKDIENEVRELLKYADENNVKLPDQKMKTQLEAMVEYLARTAEENGYHYSFQLWMPLLPDCLYLDQLAGYSDHVYDGKNWPKALKEWTLEVPVGLCDDPVNQAQIPLVLSFSENGHHAFCGMIVSGKSTLLQTLVYGLIHRYSPEYVNIYAIDYSSHMLSAFEKAPHVGGVIYEEDTEKMNKFFHMIQEMLDSRKKMFKGGNYSQYVRANGVVIPAVIVAIDNYASFREKTDNRYEEVMMHLAHDGVSYGIFLVIAAGGFGVTEIQSKVGDHIKTVVCLQMNDKFQYCDALRTASVDVMPEANVKGRGLAMVGDRLLEFQTALSQKADDDYKRMECIVNVCSQMAENWKGPCAKQIPVIPEKPLWSEFETLQEVKEMLADDRRLPLGYDMENASAYGVDLSKIYCYLISGKARTGKTNAMKALIYAAQAKGGRICVIEHGTDELMAAAGKVGAVYVSNQQEQAEFFKELVEPFQKRKQIRKELLAEGREEEIYETLLKEERICIFIGDMASFIQSIYKPEEGVLNIRPFLENITEKGRLHNVYFFVAINQDAVGGVMGLKVYENMTGYHTGIHFGGSVANLRYMNFGNLSYTEQNKVHKAGTGMLPMANEEDVSQVVVPLVKG